MGTRSKLAHGVEIKSADKGEVSAVIATLNVRDLDGDVATEDTFTEGEEVVISSYNHASMHGVSLPVGKGKIRVTPAEAILDGKFWIENMPEARSAFEVVKQMGAQQEWSYGYKVLEAEPGVFDGESVQFLKRVQVFEGSPVIRGAGIGTRTLNVKGLKDPEQTIERARTMSDYRSAVRPHETAVTWEKWDFREALAKLGDLPSIVDLRSMYAWVDPTGDPEAKSSYLYPHHDGPGGVANLMACFIGIAKLNRATILGPEIPDGDRRGVYNHLAAHLLEADVSPSELSDGKSAGSLTLIDHQAAVLAQNQELIEREGDVLALRRSKGKAGYAFLSGKLAEWNFAQMRDRQALFDTPQEDAIREQMRFIRLQQQL
jgi:hypothetical protein